MAQNPNFPQSMAISPSLPNSTHSHASCHVSASASESESDEDRMFGESAQRDAIEKFGIAGRVWEAAYIMNLYVDPPDDWECDPPFRTNHLTAIELGAGTGIVSSRIAKLCHPDRDLIIVTDLPEVCPLLEENLSSQLKSASDGVILVRPLAWGNSEHALNIISELLLDKSEINGLSHIICSDLVYFPELLAPLLRSLIQLSSPPFVPSSSEDHPVIIISYKIRSLSKETAFWAAFGLWFSFEPVLVRIKASQKEKEARWHRFGSSADGTIFVFVARRRVESFSWDVPPEDRDLLDGVGAWGTQTRKGDDTFESLLFMTLDDGSENDDPSLHNDK